MIEDIVLSPILIFLVFAAMLAAVTRYALQRGERAGYALGWLVGIFFIIIYQSLSGGESPDPETVENVTEAATNEDRLSLAAILIPSVMGLAAGVGIPFVLGTLTRTHARRSVTVAVATAGLVSLLFLITVVGETATRVFGLFAIAFAIGALSIVVFSGATSSEHRTEQIERKREGYRDDDGDYDVRRTTNEIPSADLDEARTRFEAQSRRIQKRSRGD